MADPDMSRARLGLFISSGGSTMSRLCATFRRSPLLLPDSSWPADGQCQIPGVDDDCCVPIDSAGRDYTNDTTADGERWALFSLCRLFPTWLRRYFVKCGLGGNPVARFATALVFSVVLVCSGAFGQNSAVGDPLTQGATTSERDQAALATLSRAVTAMGLTASTNQMTIRLTGSVSPMPSSETPPGTFTSVVELTNDGYQVRNEFQYASDGKQTVFVGGRSGAAFAFGRRVINMSGHVTMVTAPSQMPVFELIRALTKSQYSVIQAAPRQIGGVAAVHIKISDETDFISKGVTLQDWYFDPTSGLPLRWEFLVPDTFDATARSVSSGAREFSNYQSLNNMILPLQSIYFRDGHAISSTTIRSAELNVQISDSIFDLPKGAN
jgi:hypothetical protein